MKKLLVSLMILFLVGCSPVETRAPTAVDDKFKIGSMDYHHTALQKYNQQYTLAANKLAEQRAILADYEEHQQVYGRQGLDLPGHTEANIRYYEGLMAEAQTMISFHSDVKHYLAGR